MQIQTFHSSSAGNLYRVSDGDTALLIEAGLPIKQIKKLLSFQVSGVSGCLISHSHMDHAKAVKDLMKCGIDCYMTQGTADALDISWHRVHIIEAGKQFSIGRWQILPFMAIHNVESVGFLLDSENERLLFSVDTQYIKYRFRGLTHVMIEVNYDMKILRENVNRGSLDIFLAKQIIQNHMSLDTVKGFFKANDMSKVQEIHLLHLSNSNADAERFKKEVQEIVGRPVYIGG